MLTHRGTVRLETERLVLRRIACADTQAMFDHWASDPAVTEFLTWRPHESTDVTRAVIEDWIRAYERPDFYQWVIVPKVFGEPIGTISVVRHSDETEKAEIGYCISSAWWHQGIVTEALRAVITFLFYEVGMNRIEAKHDTNNPHSGGVMRKCGMQYEGISRAADRNNRGICDVARYAILKEDMKK